MPVHAQSQVHARYAGAGFEVHARARRGRVRSSRTRRRLIGVTSAERT